MKLSLLAFLVIPSFALADTTSATTAASAPNSTAPQPTEELKVMTQRLNLSQSQQDAIGPILVTEANNRKSIMDNTTLTPLQRHEQLGANHRASLQQIKALFTPDQLALINQEQAHPSASPTHPSTAAN